MNRSPVHLTVKSRFTALAIVSMTLCLATLAVLFDAHARSRSLDSQAIAAFVRRTGSADLALSSTSRWLRHPSLAEPGAACQDGPPCIDTEPAGMALDEARELLPITLSLRVER